ncbi:MAG: hypothetical protein NC243_11295 [Lachnoclostridium sp.]|nr:hypothetical protein [Lachnoclostridium sp.]MCM1385113.1 hypothetical protein [Lachnoclostridium sp.]
MAEFVNVPVQTIQENQNAIFTSETSRCNSGCVLHRTGSGQFTLRGNTQNCRAKYRVTFSGNIAVATGGTAGPISVAIAINGESDLSTNAIVTPAAVGDYFNVSMSTDVWIPKGCCMEVSVRNTSGQTIDMQNANITINREG